MTSRIFNLANTSNGEVMLSSFIAHLQEINEEVGDLPIVVGERYPHPPMSSSIENLPSIDVNGVYEGEGEKKNVVYIDLA